MTTLTQTVRRSAAIAMIFVAPVAFAQMTPVGKWQSQDDKTKEPKAEIVITEANGVLTGKITRLLRKDAKPDEVCKECSDDRKGQKMVGLEIIRGAKKDGAEAVWTGGKILDPENGKEYTLKLTPEAGGKTLAVRGSFGPIGRTQTWKRVE